jgi:hypothetical protein
LNTIDRQGRAFWCALLAASAVHAASVAVINTGGLAFGRFVAGSGGTLTVSHSGARSAAGGVILLGSSPAAARFTISSPPGNGRKVTIITLPPNGTVVMNNGSAVMPVNNFTSNAPPGGMLNDPLPVLNIGATLQVAPNQAAGNYSGAFQVTVEYQ